MKSIPPESQKSSCLVFLFVMLVKYQLAMQFCIVTYTFKSIIHTVFILCVIFLTNFPTKHMFAQIASTITIYHFTILYEEQPIVCMMLARIL